MVRGTYPRIVIEIKELTNRDGHLLDSVADGVFDDSIVARRCQEFLDDSRHHLIVALSDGQVVGFASAVHYVHPDKPSPELWINELGIAPEFRRLGLATSIISKLKEIAGGLGCSDIWVLTERTNEAAMNLYGSVPGSKSSDAIMFTFPATGD